MDEEEVLAGKLGDLMGEIWGSLRGDLKIWGLKGVNCEYEKFGGRIGAKGSALCGGASVLRIFC